MLTYVRAIQLLFVCYLACPFQVSAQTMNFSYYPPGSIQPKTGAEEELGTGKADYVVHAPGIDFPLAVPAFANSQYYRPGGNGYTGQSTKGQCDPSNYTYPWRDNYCESRLGSNRINGACPNGYGHQGQDIRPSECKIDYFAVRAVEDGTVAYQPLVGELVLFSADKHRLYDYLHMETAQYVKDPHTGKPVEVPGTRVHWEQYQKIKRGWILGYVSSILGTKDNTTRHLHFGLRKQKVDDKGRLLEGGKFFYYSPYMSLVRAYEAALGQPGTMLPAPKICTPDTVRCTTKSIITCTSDGTAETLKACATNQCSNDSACKGGTLPPLDMSSIPLPDLAPLCQPATCACGCDGVRCKPQLCLPGTVAYCNGNTAITCPGNGCAGTASFACPSGYVCSGGNCYLTMPPADMSTGSPHDMSSTPVLDLSVPSPKPEVCNGIDDDGNGIIDDPASCWQWITRFKDPITGARCYGNSAAAPFACAAYDREFVLFATPVVPWPDGSTSAWVQCSRGIDHVLTKKDSSEHKSLEALGWNCTLNLGYFFDAGKGPRSPKRTPFINACSLYRQRFSVAGSQSHLFTPFSESIGGAICEPPIRADVVSNSSCGLPPGC